MVAEQDSGHGPARAPEPTWGPSGLPVVLTCSAGAATVSVGCRMAPAASAGDSGAGVPGGALGLRLRPRGCRDHGEGERRVGGQDSRSRPCPSWGCPLRPPFWSWRGLPRLALCERMREGTRSGCAGRGFIMSVHFSLRELGVSPGGPVRGHEHPGGLAARGREARWLSTCPCLAPAVPPHLPVLPQQQAGRSRRPSPRRS